MGDEITNAETIKTTSDGFVKISIEKYNELVDTVADQKGSISRLKESLTQARNEPPVVVNRTTVEKTPEMLAREYRAWGATCMGGGASLFIIGAFLFKAGLPKK